QNRSAVFAQTLLDHVGRESQLLARGHRNENFAVLLAPDVPAVLLEMGFITSPEDERMLTDLRARQRLVGAVADAIDSYFATEFGAGLVGAMP
ncbi:MAG TPA: N-acetylmuramoyl-L-alanine amidase, partial [Caulobacteraceae bacterium]